MTLKNIKENATIKLESLQSAGEKTEKSEFSYFANFYIKDGKKYIIYTEKKDNGMGDSSVMLKIEENFITMRRQGEFAYVMEYKKGEKTKFLYRVPYGTIEMEIETTDICDELSQNGGKLAFSYILTASGEETKTEINISVTMK